MGRLSIRFSRARSTAPSGTATSGPNTVISTAPSSARKVNTPTGSRAPSRPGNRNAHGSASKDSGTAAIPATTAVVHTCAAARHGHGVIRNLRRRIASNR